MKELDEVDIPIEIAEKEGVFSFGTVVWYLDGAPFATVECTVLKDNPDWLETKLLDIDIKDLLIRREA